ncbi:hypothetical protein QZH41_017294, partial [Actinostola sp. cb2023]
LLDIHFKPNMFRISSTYLAFSLQIPDDYTAFPLDMFCIPKHYEDDLKHVMLPRGILLDRTERLAKNICKDLYPGSLVDYRNDCDDSDDDDDEQEEEEG